MKNIGLSIDFDFFCREDPNWQFGHSDKDSLATWASRYLHIDLIKETDIKKYADFEPSLILEKLKEKNLTILKNTILGIADDHSLAYGFFKRFNNNLIINIDAHHDCWPITSEYIPCSNWLTRLNTDSITVYPKWKDINLDTEISKTNHKNIKWMDFEINESNMINCVFICRSPQWVAPHLDQEFYKMINNMIKILAPEYLQQIKPRLINFKEINEIKNKIN